MIFLQLMTSLVVAQKWSEGYQKLCETKRYGNFIVIQHCIFDERWVRSSWKLVPRLNLGQRIRKSRSRKLKILEWKWSRRKEEKTRNYGMKLKIGTYTNFRSADLKIELTKTENLQMKVKKKKKEKSCKVIRSSWKLVPTLNLGRRFRKSRASKLKTLQWTWRRTKRRKNHKLSEEAENWHLG